MNDSLKTQLTAITAALCIGATVAQANPFTWTQTVMAPQDWTDAANWDGFGPFVSSSNNDLVFFPDTSTRNPIGTQTYTNLPAALSMRTLTMNGRGPNSTQSSFSIVGSNTETWTIGDGATGTVSYNPASGGGGDRYHNYTLNVNMQLNQTTEFTGNSAAPRGLTITGDIGETGAGFGLTKSGNHLLILSGNSSYTGDTTVSGGTLRLENLSALPGGIGQSGGTSNLFLNGGVLELNGAFERGLGTGADQFRIGSSGQSGWRALNGDLDITVNDDPGQTLVWGSADFNPGNFRLESTGLAKTTLNNGVDTAGGSRLFRVNSGRGVITGTVAGAGTLRKVGGGTLVLTGNNTYSATTNLEQGLVSVETSDNLGTGAVDFRGGGLEIRGNTLSSFSQIAGGGNTVNYVNGTFNMSVVEKDHTFTADLVVSSGGLNKTGAGTLVMNQTNSFNGQSTVGGGGTLVLDYTTDNGSKLTDGQRLNSGNTSIVLRGGSHAEVISQLSLIAFNGTANSGGSTNISRDGGTATIATGNISHGSRSGRTLWVAENGIATTTRSNDGTTGILGGWAVVGSDFALNNGGNLEATTTYTAATTAGISAGTDQVQLTGGGTLTGGITANGLRISNSGNSDVLEAGSQQLRVSRPNGAGGLIYAGGFDDNYTINGTGQLTAQNANQEFNIYVHAGTLTLNIPVLNNASASAPLNKAGDGTLVFGTDVTYNGSTYINGGTLLINGQHDGADGQINVLGGTLGGTGTINSNVFVFGGSSVAPGVSPGTLTFASGADLTLDGGGTSLLMEIEGTNTSEFDRIVGIDELQLNGDLIVDVTGTFATNDSWDLLDFGSVNGDLDEVVVDGQVLSLAGTLWSSADYTFEQTTGVLTFIGGGGPSFIAGDFNGDGTVDAADYTLWRDNEGAADESAFAPGSGTGSGGITIADYNLWRANFGNTAPPLVGGGGGAVPEPGTIALLVGGLGLGLMTLRKNRK